MATESRRGRWAFSRRIQVAVWIAAIEALVVFFSHDITKWFVVALAVVAVLTWLAGRDSNSKTIRAVLWVFAASQLLAVIAVVLGVFVKWALILAIVVFAVIGLTYLFLDRR